MSPPYPYLMAPLASPPYATFSPVCMSLFQKCHLPPLLSFHQIKFSVPELKASAANNVYPLPAGITDSCFLWLPGPSGFIWILSSPFTSSYATKLATFESVRLATRNYLPHGLENEPQ